MEKQEESPKEMSKSRIWVERLNILVDYASWIIIAFFIYVWWNARGAPIELTCDMISIDMCNACFARAQEIINPLVLP